jgi:hypothetical protein
MVTRPPDACAWVAATQAKGMRCGACGAVRCGAVRCGGRGKKERDEGWEPTRANVSQPCWAVPRPQARD